MTNIDKTREYGSEDEQLNVWVRDRIANTTFDIETPVKLIKKWFKRLWQMSSDLFNTLLEKKKKDKK